MFEKNVLEIVGNVAGIMSILITILSIISNRLTQYIKLKELRSQQFYYIIESSDIVRLGNYLDNEIGKLTVSDYVDSNDLTKRVDALLNKLTSFVGTEKDLQIDIEEQKDLESNINRESYKSHYKAEVDPEFNRILNELYTGETWNALARLRRYLELLLNKIATENNIDLARPNLTQLITVLSNEKVIDDNITRGLKYAINVSNRAIHGQEIDYYEAERAIFTAGDWITTLSRRDKNI